MAKGTETKGNGMAEKLFPKFGELGSAEEINRAAEAQKKEGDFEALKALAKENGIDVMDAEDYFNGDIPELCTELSAALGKLEVEKADIGIEDMTYGAWVAAIQLMICDDAELRRTYRRKGKRLYVILAKVTVECSKTRTNAPKQIADEARRIDKSIPSPLPMGSISIADLKQMVKDYYFSDEKISTEKHVTI